VFDTPHFGATSSAFRPASTCFNAAMICTSVCLLKRGLSDILYHRKGIRLCQGKRFPAAAMSNTLEAEVWSLGPEAQRHRIIMGTIHTAIISAMILPFGHLAYARCENAYSVRWSGLIR
jgi:hypothetical protein